MNFAPSLRPTKFTALALTLLIPSLSCQTRNKQTQRRESGQDTNTGPSDKGTAKKSTVNPGLSAHTVMIIDDGFDVSHEVLKPKVVGQYTINCEKDTLTAPDTEFRNSSLEQAKTVLKQRYRLPNSGCSVTDGINFSRPANFAQIEAFRERWNDGLKRKVGTLDQNTVQTITRVLSGSGEFHGTNTSGLIGYQNADVKLVLVEMELGGPDSPKQLGPCPTQRSVNTWVEAHRDPEVRKAYIESPSDAMEASLDDIVKKYNVTLVNMSFGRTPRPLLEKSLADAGCGRLDYKAFYETTIGLERARDIYARAKGPAKDLPRPLAIQAAGNDGVQVDSISDSYECSDPTSNLIVAGSVDLNGQRSKFSNFGRCVDYYTLGARVIVAAPDNFLSVANGTSFSAPLLVRYISKEFPATDSTATIMKKLKSRADTSGNLPGGAAPIELSYEDESKNISAYTLTPEAPEEPIRKYLPLHFRWGLGGFH